VLVHPGKGWDSKSFPKEYWERVIAGISAAGLQVVLVGKDISDEQGTIQIDVPQGVIDARNLLSLGGLIALVGKARVLISNDSSPVHIAAAFENEIILIPTCKHPDHVLAPRAGGRMWRAQALYKRLLFDAIDSTPTQIHGKTIDKVVGDIMDYLPEVDEVIEAAKKAYGRTE
jgi:heptosyltransferase-2